MTPSFFKPEADVSLIGEIDARRELVAEGWLTINTNTEKGNFPNVDLIAVKGEKSRHIQVKTSNAEDSKSHRDCLFLGRGEKWLTEKISFFNSKPGPIHAQLVVLVHAKREASRFVVLPVGLAEYIARYHVEAWYAVPKRDGGQRSPGFDARLPFKKLRNNASEVDRFNQATLLEFENRWDIVDESIDRLQDAKAWGIDLPFYGSFS